MYLKNIALLNFKNFDSLNFEFDRKINCFIGANGVGKTNVLDAIYHLSFTKSYFNPSAVQNIRHNQEFYVIDGVFNKKDEEEKIICSLKKGQKKVVKRNGKEYDKLANHIGKFPLVIISPADRNLISEGSELRRKFIDSVVSQLDKSYLKTLISYNKVLSQRNHLLKYFAANHTFDALNIEIYDNQLMELGAIIFKKRKSFLNEFIPIFKKRYQLITNGKEEVSLKYKSQLEKENLKSLLQENLMKDRVLQYTTVGIHKDDLKFYIEDYSIKKFGSQGQQKSFLIALKLAQFDFIKKQANVTPILIMDDIFDKLDEHRVKQLVSLVNETHFGQIFISDTHEERTKAVIESTKQSYKIFNLN